MEAAGNSAAQALTEFGAQVGGSRRSWFKTLRHNYPGGLLPEVSGDRDIVAINFDDNRLVIAEVEGDSSGQPETKLYKAIGQVVVAIGETKPNGFAPNYVLVVKGVELRTHTIRAKALELLGVSAVCLGTAISDDEWLFGGFR